MAHRTATAARPHRTTRVLIVLLSIAGLAPVACTVEDVDLLGGRERCWDEAEPRMASIMQGTLQIGRPGTYLANPNEDDLPLLPGALVIVTTPNGVRLVDKAGTVAAAEGDSVTLFGGIGADGAMVVCAVEARQAP